MKNTLSRITLLLIFFSSLSLTALAQGGQVVDLCPNNTNPDICWTIQVQNQTPHPLYFFWEYPGICGDIRPADLHSSSPSHRFMDNEVIQNEVKIFAGYLLKYPNCDNSNCVCPSKFYVDDQQNLNFFNPWGPLSSISGPYPWTVTYSNVSLSGNTYSVKMIVEAPDRITMIFY